MEKEIRTALGIDESTDIIETITTLADGVKTLTETVKTLTDEKTSAEDAKQKAEIAKQKAEDDKKKLSDGMEGKKVLTDAEFDTLSANAQAGMDAKKSLHGRDVSDLVTKALTDGKIIPANTEWFKSLADKDIVSAKLYMEKTPANTLTDATPGHGNPGAEEAENAGDIVDARAMELTDKDPKLSYDDAVNKVLSDDAGLAAQYNKSYKM